MSHDARWFMAVATEYGMQVANRLNQVVAHEVGKVEAKRIVRALQLPPVTTLEEYLLTQELFIALLGPELVEYSVFMGGDRTFRMHIRRCFAYENSVRAGIADHLECGIFARMTGWPEALRVGYQITPSLGKCLKVQGRECTYTITLIFP